MERQHIYEHALHTGAMVVDPAATLTILRGEQPLAVYGFYRLSRQDLEDAMMLRATQLLSCSCVDDQLQEIWGKAESATQVAEFHYDPDSLTFKTV